MRFPRWLTGLLLGLVLIGCVIGGLSLVSPWHASEFQSCPNFTHFPLWLGCTITAHETLAGGLVAAAGALFSAWLAFSAVQDQIGIARENERLARQVANERHINEVARDCDRVKLAHGFVTQLAAQFPSSDDKEIGKSAFSAKLLDLRRIGGLQPSANALEAPEGIGDSIKTVVARLNTFADNLHAETAKIAGELKPGILQRSDNEVREQVKDLRLLSRILQQRVLVFEARFADAVARADEAVAPGTKVLTGPGAPT
jgi:hypothetical protein